MGDITVIWTDNQKQSKIANKNERKERNTSVFEKLFQMGQFGRRFNPKSIGRRLRENRGLEAQHDFLSQSFALFGRGDHRSRSRKISFKMSNVVFFFESFFVLFFIFYFLFFIYFLFIFCIILFFIFYFLFFIKKKVWV